MDLVDGVVVAANPSVVAALSFRTDFSTREFRMVFSARLRRNDQGAGGGRGSTDPRLTAQCVAVTLAWSGADLVVKGARSIKGLKNYATV